VEEVIEEEGPLFGPDHNQPPALLEREPAIADLREWLTERLQPGDKTFGQRKAEFLRAAANAVVRSRETAGEVRKLIDAERMRRTNPYRAVADALKAEVDDFWFDVESAMVELRRLIDRWTDEEDERIAQQQREQDAEMERMRAASAPADPPPAPAPAAQPRRRSIRGDYGSKVTTAERKNYEIIDVRLLPDWVMTSPAVRDAILLVVRQTAKHMGDIPGIRVTTSTENQIR
jgi:hypothetical protein